MRVEVYSFFAGVGIMDLGFEDAGFNIVFVNENNKNYLKAYKYARRNNNNTPTYGYDDSDIRDYLDENIWDGFFPNFNNDEKTLTMFIGGPPCPDFSIAGNNSGERGKNGCLSTVYVNLIIKRSPDLFVFENVKGLYRTKKHRKYYDRLKEKLKESGYVLFDSIENALLYGVPQYRERLILIGFKKKTFGDNVAFEIGRHRKYEMKTVEAIPWPKTNTFRINSSRRMPSGVVVDLTIENWFRNNHVNRHPNGNEFFNIKSIERYHTIPEGDSGGKSFKRLHRWRYSPTAAYGNNEVHLHPYRPRRLSVAEVMAIQSLPEDFILPNDICLSSKYKMIANGVPYLLSKGIAEDILDVVK